MTTRSLTAVKLDGSYKVANFGHYDGYPTGQGIYALKFLLEKMQKEKFIKRLSQLHFAKTDKEKFESQKRQNEFDGALILEYIQNSNDNIVVNNLKFLEDTIYCQWAYVIDFDNNTFEIYSNNRTSEKYGKLNNRREFRYLNLIKIYDLNKLPTLEEFEDRFDF